MAHRYWGANQGDTETAVQEGSADLGTNVEVVVDLSVGMSKQDVRVALIYIANAILKDQWPPA